MHAVIILITMESLIAFCSYQHQLYIPKVLYSLLGELFSLILHQNHHQYYPTMEEEQGQNSSEQQYHAQQASPWDKGRQETENNKIKRQVKTETDQFSSMPL